MASPSHLSTSQRNITVCLLNADKEISHAICFGKGNGRNDNSQLSPKVATKYTTYTTDVRILLDDTIHTIKWKILRELHNGPNSQMFTIQPCYEEIYLYGYKDEPSSDPLTILRKMKRDSPITLDELETILAGYPDKHSILERIRSTNAEQSAWTAEELAPIFGDNKPNIRWTVRTPIGAILENIYDPTFIVDPFYVSSKDDGEKDNKSKELMFFDKTILLNYGDLIDDTIYLCFARHVLDIAPNIETEEFILHNYYPKLYESGVHNQADWEKRRESLEDATKSLLTTDRTNYYRSIQTMVEIGESGGIQYIANGIRATSVRIKNQKVHSVNLEMLFKNMHCSREIPAIKYNPGSKREKLYRFYYERTTHTGKKTPFLTRSEIGQLSTKSRRLQQITLFLDGVRMRVPGVSLCLANFETDGNILLQFAFKSLISESELNQLIQDHVYPVLYPVLNDIQSTGFNIQQYEHIRNNNVQIVDLEYVAKTAAVRKHRWEAIPCIYSVCALNKVDRSITIARLNRVENYEEMNEAKILALDLYKEFQNQQIELNDIVSELKYRNLVDSTETAEKLVADVAEEAKFINGESLQQGGFPIYVNVNSDNRTVEYTVHNITNIAYLDTVPHYIAAFLKITQFYRDDQPEIIRLQNVCTRFKETAQERKLQAAVNIGPHQYVPGKTSALDMLFASDSDETEHYQPGENPPSFTSLPQINEMYEFEEEIDEYDAEPSPKLEVPQESEPTAKLQFTPSPESPSSPSPKLATAPQESTAKLQFTPSPESPSSSSPKLEVPQESTAKLQFTPSPESPSSSSPKLEVPPPSEPELDNFSFMQISSPPAKIEFMDSESEEDESGKTNENNVIESPPLQESPKTGVSTEPPKQDNAPSAKLQYIDSDIEDDDEDDSTTTTSQEQRGGKEDSPLLPTKGFVLKRLHERDPALFSTAKTDKYKGYSTSCQPTSRHPIILSKDEFDKTDKSAYEHVVKYGSDPKNQNYFVCPKYWCFKTNSAISEADVKAGKCGGIIPPNFTNIPQGAYVYELNKDAPYPGFIKDKHPSGHCLPCCFKNWSGQQQTIRAECAAKMELSKEDAAADTDDDEPEQHENPQEQPTTKSKVSKRATAKPTANKKAQNYIMNLDKFPLEQNRWGYLQIPAQLFLNMDYRPAIEPHNPALLQPNKRVLLRYGIEQPDGRSFLGAFAHLYAKRQKLTNVPTVNEFQNILAQQITLDIFARAHNAALLSAFLPSAAAPAAASLKKLATKYANTEFALGLDMEDPGQFKYLTDAIRAYEHFIQYLQNGSLPLDHTYLWDFVCEDNPHIMPKGVNLIIMEIDKASMIDRIELICPTSLHSRNQFDKNKDSVLLLKHGNLYEPIFVYTSNESGIPEVIHFLNTSNVPPSILYVLKNVEYTMQKYCERLPSLPRLYKFAPPVLLDKMRDALKSAHMSAIAYVINYQSKIIGVMVNAAATAADSTNNTNAIEDVFIPCAPTSRPAHNQLPIKYMDDLEIVRSYADTYERLKLIAEKTRLPCKPLWKITDGGMVVGFLTETNQFVPIQPNQNIVKDELRTYEGVSHFEADKLFATSKTEDPERIKRIKYIDLENQFYYAFRNRVRTLLAAFANREMRAKLQEIDSSRELLYSQKIVQAETIIARIIQTHIIFVDIDDDVLENMHEMEDCPMEPLPGQETQSSPTCIWKENGISQLVIPKTNLIYGMDNERVYVGRIADELMRNRRVKEFMYNTETRLNAKQIDYSIKRNEFILVESVLNEYLEDINKDNSFMGSSNADVAIQTTYELAKPAISVPYPTTPLELSDQLNLDTAMARPPALTTATQTVISAISDASVKAPQPSVKEPQPSVKEQQPSVKEPQPSVKEPQPSRLPSNTSKEQEEDESKYYQLECIETAEKKIIGTSNSFIKQIFSNSSTDKEIIFKATPSCTFGILISIMNKFNPSEKHNINSIKLQLIEAYKRLFQVKANYLQKVVNIMMTQGKKKMFSHISPSLYTLDDFLAILVSESYYLSDMDIWVFAHEYKIPVILFNMNGLKGFFSGMLVQWVKIGGTTRDHYYFVRSTIGSFVNKVYSYHLLSPTKTYESKPFELMIRKTYDSNGVNIQTLYEMLDTVVGLN